MSKVIALNSGGFDSVVLINDLIHKGCEVISLFFNWGQKNYKQEVEKARKVGGKCSEHIEVDISIPWVNDLGGNDYIPMRNLIFVSYAISLGEKVEAKEVYIALVDNELPYDRIFSDCTEDFIECLEGISDSVRVKAPYIYDTKEMLYPLALTFNITQEDYFSCNNPHNGLPCGECGDCYTLNMMYNDIDFNLFHYIRLDLEDKIKELYSKTPRKHSKVFINNKCNMECSHCYLPREKSEVEINYFKVIDRLNEYGIEHIDFFGKEVLFDDTVFKYVDYIKSNYPHIQYSMITNGLSLKKYCDRLLESGLTQLTVSLDSLERLTSRNHLVIDNINYCRDKGLVVDISLDLTDSNYLEAPQIVKQLNEWGHRVYVKPILALGNTDKGTEITHIEHFCSEGLKLDIECTLDLLRPIFNHLKEDSILLYTNLVEGNKIRVEFESYCSYGIGGLDVDYKGNVLGCLFCMGEENYIKYSNGNILTDDFKYIENSLMKDFVEYNIKSENYNCFFKK